MKRLNEKVLNKHFEPIVDAIKPVLSLLKEGNTPSPKFSSNLAMRRWILWGSWIGKGVLGLKKILDRIDRIFLIFSNFQLTILSPVEIF
ncbi:MAG: hypothetical protein GY797_15600 [Deltaproteobacteria bacterium]|nr:hypothetical protein [Deltaproteobacteria bacterium]